MWESPWFNPVSSSSPRSGEGVLVEDPEIDATGGSCVFAGGEVLSIGGVIDDGDDGVSSLSGWEATGVG